MLPFKKLQLLLGYSNLAILMEQDRRHWLMKTDKKLQTQNASDGSIFQGVIDNQGSYIDISTMKFPYVNVVLVDKLPEKIAEIFELTHSALPYSYEVNGMYMSRIISTQYRYTTGNKNYKVRFENCTEVLIPLAGATSTDVFAFRFIKTTTKPKLKMIDGNGEYTIVVDVDIDIDNVVYYYPLDAFQPIEIDDLGNGTYETILIDDDAYIGYPAFWFTCDETDGGPKFSITSEDVVFSYGNIKDNMYNPFVYIMDAFRNNDLYIRVYPATGYTFNGDSSDFTVPIDMTRIRIVDVSGSIVAFRDVTVVADDNTVLKMESTRDSSFDWLYKTTDGGCYDICLSAYNKNYTDLNTKLIPIFGSSLDNSIPFETETKDVGYADIDITAKSQEDKYPQNLNMWDGLPDWITENNDSSQRLVVYAIHDTPNSSAESPMTRQTAAVILDPGVPVTAEESELSEDEKGRVYIISNDDATYANNALTEYPKPARTAARICDIPVSVMQLANISGLAPTPIVDPKYVRSEASFSHDDKNRLYNVLNDRWVRPTNLNTNGIPINVEFDDEDNDFVFSDPVHLNSVDLYNYNDFRTHTQLDEYVDVDEVSLYLIVNGGADYAQNDVGTIVVGGFAFDYIVSEVDASGSVTQATIAPSHAGAQIHISNFDMEPGTSGVTNVYGTSPRGSSIGTGLKLQFMIQNYTEKIPAKGNVYDGLYAFVKESTGIYMYEYKTASDTWTRSELIAPYETTTSSHPSTKDSYIRSILPNIKSLPASYKKAGVKDASIKTISTASFVNIIDTDVFPIYDAIDQTRKVVDINKFCCHIIKKATAQARSFKAVIEKIKNNHDDRFDSYIIWRWLSTTTTDTEFEYGIVHRSFNNLQSTDSTTTLPDNELPTERYVNTNASTTIAWDVPNFGPMVWTFNPSSNVREVYSINQDSRDLYVERFKLKWEDVEVYTDDFQTKIPVVDANGKLLWNIASNITSSSPVATVPIYQQPDYTNMLNQGTSVSGLIDDYLPRGNWQLIFPRVQMFTFRNDVSGVGYTPMRMELIRGINVQPNTDVLDSYGNPINYKTMIIDSSDDNTSSIKVYNNTTGEWNKI